MFNTEDTQRLVQNFAKESESYLRQLHVWLGTASAGGAIAMATLAANLPEPSYSFEFLLVSFWCFLVGVVSAGSAVFALAMRASAKEVHFASAHNRESINSAIKAIPEIIASTKSLADSNNKERNELVEKSEKEHKIAEKAWERQLRWNIFCVLALVVSSLAFIGGFAWPLVQIGMFDKQITHTIAIEVGSDN